MFNFTRCSRPEAYYDVQTGNKTESPNAILSPNSMNGLGYLGFNTVHTQDGWLVAGNGSQNAGTLLYNSPYGEMFFCTIPISEGHNDKQFTQTEMGNYTRMTINNIGYVGIGTMGPECSLDIRKNFNAKIKCFSRDDSQASIWIGNINSNYGFVVSDQGVCHLSSNMGSPSSIMSLRPGIVGITGNAEISGKVGIGAVTLSNFPNSTSKLFVEGGITTEEVRVLLIGEWSDFVFKKGYKLRSLSDLANYIEANNHLPDVPTSSEVDKDGIDLGKMNTILLQKVEELTLYILQLEKRMGELESKQKTD